ncbi:YbaB/EbfC family nucleoid-associated protein [Oryzobacter telluris]|uniref:YbaB/EbfC family nucleoid-associated protein n=1 Tax=Oryzobacter telluris TaxID=3149179 RepID=UPI00370D0899
MSQPRGYSSPQEALAAIAAQTAQAGPEAERARAWSDEVAALEGTGTAAKGHVKATVDVQGLLTGLAVSDELAARGGTSVTSALQQAVRAAQESVRDQAVRSSERVWGPDSATTAAFRGEVETATRPVEVEPLPTDGPGSAPPPPRRPQHDGGTW